MHFGEDKTKSILFGLRQNGEGLGIKFRVTDANHHKHMGFLGYILNKMMLGEAVAFRETQISISKKAAFKNSSS